jgi:hypothetical protein
MKKIHSKEQISNPHVYILFISSQEFFYATVNLQGTWTGTLLIYQIFAKVCPKRRSALYPFWKGHQV